MPRRPRIHYSGAFYHVMARGNRKQEVFQDDGDYQTYLRLVRKYSERYEVEVHGYVLMPNHVHFLLRVGETPLAKFMQGVQQSYTQIFNKQYEQVGHLFQGRFKSLLVDKDSYLLELIRYVHLNPVKAGLVRHPRHYRWSSQWHYYRTGGKTWVKTDFIKGVLKQYGGTVIDDYQLVPETIAAEVERALDDGIESSQTAPQAVPRAHTTIAPTPSSPGTAHPQLKVSGPDIRHKPDLPTLLHLVSEFTGIPEEMVTGSGRSSEILNARRLFVFEACRYARYNIAEAAEFLGRTNSCVSKMLHWVEENYGTTDNDTLSRLTHKIRGSGPSKL